MKTLRHFAVLLVFALLLPSCKKATQTANEMADQSLYRPVEYRNAALPGPAIVVLPGSVSAGHILYRQKIKGENIADFGELEMSKAGFSVLDHENLAALVAEISLAAEMGDPQALKVFRKGKFAKARYLVRFDLTKAECVSRTNKAFDGVLLGAVAGGLLAGLTNSQGLGTAAGSAIASIKSAEESSVWQMGMRYAVIDAATGQVAFTGDAEETVDVRRTLQGFMGSTQQTNSLLPLEAVTLRMVQQCVQRIDADNKNAMNSAGLAETASAGRGRPEKDIMAQYEEAKRKKEEERKAEAYASRFEGVYTGKFEGGTKGDIYLVVNRNTAEGQVSNTDGLIGTFTGPLDVATGTMQCPLAGNISFIKFKGSVTGAIQGSQVSGEWIASGFGTEKGTWTASIVQ